MSNLHTQTTCVKASSLQSSLFYLRNIVAAMNVPSDLSNPQYGYDFVVSITQAGINATMKIFLSKLSEPIVTCCYVADDHDNPVFIDYDKLKAMANGSDPFSIPADADTETNQDLQNLLNARFKMGFRAQLGLPRVHDRSLLPNLVNLGSDTAAVEFNMLCSTFTIVDLKPPSRYNSTLYWMNQKQDPNNPWIFTSKVDLRLSTVSPDLYSQLPSDVQQQIMNLGSNAFSVQQLLFDLTNAALMTMPTIQGVDPGSTVYTVLQQEFCVAYFRQMQQEHKPLLGCSITMADTPPSATQPTFLDLQVNPYLDANGYPYLTPTSDQQELSTLSYLCAVNNNQLPPAVPFTWNWVDASQESDHDGVVSINRNTLINYFETQLIGYARPNCLGISGVKAWLEYLEVPEFSWDISTGNMPTVTYPSGSTVLSFDWSSSDGPADCGLGGEAGGLSMSNTYSMTVEFLDTTIVITQHQVVYVDAWVFRVSGSGNIVDKTVVDTYSLDIDENGNLMGELASSSMSDNSYNSTVNGFLDFFTQINELIADIKAKMNFAATNLTDIPVSFMQNFIFPGGQTFFFKQVGFSAFQDLVSYITYREPSTKPPPGSPATGSGTGSGTGSPLFGLPGRSGSPFGSESPPFSPLGSQLALLGSPSSEPPPFSLIN